MISIKYSSDLKKVMNFIEKSLNAEFDTFNKFPTSPPFAKGFFGDGLAEQENPFDQEEKRQSPFNYVNEYQDNEDLYHSNEEARFSDEYKDYSQAELDSPQPDKVIDRDFWEEAREPGLKVETSGQISPTSQSISRQRLREAIVWSEILGPPVSRRRHNRRARYK